MPALIESEHPSCAHLIAAYKHCSASKSLLSKIFFSECTTLKYQLDACFREEKLVRTQHNIAKGKVRCRSLRAGGVSSAARGRALAQLPHSCAVNMRTQGRPGQSIHCGAESRGAGMQVLRERILEAKRDRDATLTPRPAP